MKLDKVVTGSPGTVIGWVGSPCQQESRPRKCLSLMKLVQ